LYPMKLRIPIFLLVLGVASGIVQLLSSNYSYSSTESRVVTIGFFLVIGITVFIAESSGLNEKKVNLLSAPALIVIGVLFDIITA
jgi:Na+-translocating ferredoxin:NAD+ oxidoreductase RnfE subunit